MELDEVIEENLNGIDFGEYDEFFSQNENILEQTGNSSFLQMIMQALKGEISLTFEDFVNAFFSAFKNTFTSFLPLFLTVGGICLVVSIFSNISGKEENVKKATHFATFLAISTILLTSFFSLFNLIKDSVLAMKNFLEISFPIMLTTMSAGGGVVSAKIFSPLALMLLSVLTNIIVAIVLPLFLVQTIFCIISHLNSNVKISSIHQGLNSAIKWILGLSFTIFMAFLVIKGITASVYDGISLRAAKYTISNSVPIVGGYLKDGFDLVLSGCVLIKNAVGVGSMLIILLISLSPLISLLCFCFCMKITLMCIQPICTDKIFGFLKDMNKNTLTLITILASATFVYFLSLLLFVMTGNACLS